MLEDGDSVGVAADSVTLDIFIEKGIPPKTTAPEGPQSEFLSKYCVWDNPEAHRQWVLENVGFGEFAAYAHFQLLNESSWIKWVYANNGIVEDAKYKPSKCGRMHLDRIVGAKYSCRVIVAVN